MKKTVLFASLALVPASMDARPVTGSICGPDQEPLAGLKVNFTTPDEEVFTGTTDEEGTFVVEVPDEETRPGVISVDSVNVIEGGFALPAFVPWNPNLNLQIPVIELEEIIPTITFERRLDGTNCLRFNFDWVAGATPQTLRTYCVDRSKDCLTWTTIMNVGMACPPVEFIDATAPDDGSCYYRIRPLEPIFMPALIPLDFGMIGDPGMVPWAEEQWLVDWPGNVVTVEEGMTLDDGVPIIAPEIRLVPDPGE